MLSDSDFLRVVEATPLVSIDLILKNGEGKILLGRRTNRPALGTWFVPGGRIRKNERVAEALQRISQCELGVEITQARLLGVFDHLYPDNFLGAPEVSTHYVVIGLEATWPAEAHVTADEQHDEFKWWAAEEILASGEVHENTKAYFRRPVRG